MNTSFALRGILSGRDSVDGLRRPLSFEQLSGQKAVAQFPYGSPLRAHPSNSLPGSRAIHGSQPVLDSVKGAFANRPLSPHIDLKKPQIYATYSIYHRIFGGVVASVIQALIPAQTPLSNSIQWLSNGNPRLGEKAALGTVSIRGKSSDQGRRRL